LAYLGKLVKTNYMKTRPVAEELFHADIKTDDGQKDITMQIVRFRIKHI